MSALKRVLPVLLLLNGFAFAGPPIEFLDDAEQARFNTLSTELRCLVCQNQSLADSDAGLAEDLRQEVLKQMREGKNNAEVKTFLVERYGDFVLYRPPLQTNTLFLWLGPGALLLIGGFFVLLNVRNRARMIASESEPEQQLDQPGDSRPKS
jgi:cytochrome c-type biogenesis protein CcmH